jgi:hypothetical protein
MTRDANQRKAQAAWDRIEDLGGHGVWEPEICFVILKQTNVTDDALVLFRDLPFVQLLDLSHTRVGDAGLAHLAGLKTLRDLIIVDTNISEAAVEAFRREHPSVKVSTKRQPPPPGAINPFTGKPFEMGQS